MGGLKSGAQLITLPDKLHTGLQHEGWGWRLGGFVLKAGPRANLSAEQAFPSGLLPWLEQELIVLMMVSGGTIDQR